LTLSVNIMDYGSAYIQFLCSISFFKFCLLWANVEKYGTAVQTTVDNIILRIRPAYSVTSATDTHSPYTVIIAVGYTRVHH
jgi:hypothetical protein